MFSQLGPLFKTTFRQAESNDTRQAIPHDERDKGRKKNEDEHKKEKSPELWEDDTSVSVNALRIFLIDFLKTMPGATDQSAVSKPPPPAQALNATPSPTEGKNAQAIRAYQSMANQSPDIPPPVEASAQTGRVEPTADLLQSKEIRDIHALISDLDSLSRDGVQTLHILKAESFIESLKNAVALIKSNA